MAAQTVAAFAVDEWLQTNLLHAGVLWHLILFVFQYDYTLDESGVDTSDETNTQEVSNNLARLSIEAVAKLAGFKCVCVCVCVCVLWTLTSGWCAVSTLSREPLYSGQCIN